MTTADFAEEIERERQRRDWERTHGPSNGKADGTPWPEPQPLPAGLPSVEPFAADLLPRAVRPWITDVAERIQCPPDYPAVGVMVALGAVIGRQVGIRPKRRDDWTVIPNLWGAVVGRPGLLKTPSLQEAMRPLLSLEMTAKAEHENAMREFEATQRVTHEAAEVRAEQIRKRLKAGADAADLAREAAEHEDEPEEPVRRRYVTNDATVEKMGELLRDNPRGVLVFRDELIGWLRSLDRDGREQDRAFYLEAWNGTGRFSYDRIGRGTIDIEAACVSILGGIQPGPLGAYTEQAARGGTGDDGLLQRFQLVVWPDPAGEWRDVDRWPDGPARTAARELFAVLDQLDATGIGAEQDEHGGVPFLRLDPDAQEMFVEWRGDLESRLRAGDLHPAFEAHLAKYRSLVPSLAVVCHLADVGAGPVGAEATARALAWSTYLESHAARLYDGILRADLTAARTLGKKIKSGALADGFAARDVYRNAWSGLATPNAVRSACDVLADLDWLRAEEHDTGGRRATVYRTNPQLGASRDA